MLIIRRDPNPGVWTSLFLLIPFGAAEVWVINQWAGASFTDLGLAVLVVLAWHSFIILRALINYQLRDKPQ